MIVYDETKRLVKHGRRTLYGRLEAGAINKAVGAEQRCRVLRETGPIECLRKIPADTVIHACMDVGAGLQGCWSIDIYLYICCCSTST